MVLHRRQCLQALMALGTRFVAPSAVLALVGCNNTSREPDQVGFNGTIMGTGYSVRLNAQETATLAVTREELVQRVHDTLRQVDELMSTWRSDSEISRFNARRDDDWHPLASDSLAVVSQALDVSRETQGAFDPTIGPLVDLWGFGAGSADRSISSAGAGSRPAIRAIDDTMALIGHAGIEIDARTSAVRKSNVDAQLDLSGIAKGFAVDCVCRLLDSLGVQGYLVEVGGELKAHGSKSDGSSWRVAIERPVTAGDREVLRVVNLQGRAIATSGDYRHFFIEAGQRYSHSIDPRTGQPVNHELASVSVVARTTMQADALSTAMMILGPADAMAYAQDHGIAAHFVLKSDHSLDEHYTPEFSTLIS